MNRQLFLHLLEHPSSVSESESVALQKFTEDFPYCQTGRLLYVKHLHSQQSVHYPEQLKIAAAYAGDRKVLYNLIHTPAKEVEVAEEHMYHGEPISLIEEQIEESPTPIPQEVISEKKIIEEPISQIDIIQKRLREIASRKTTGAVPKVEEKKKELKSEPAPAEKETLIHTQEIIQPEIEERKKEEDPKSGKHSFTGWLKTVKKESPTPSVAEEQKLVSSTDEIINRFIEAEPRIIPSKAEFYNPVKMAKQSLEEHDDLVSETLAGVFAEQGNLPRAIEMYRKLMLSNPEKSSFFAALVEKLTQQLNEGK